MMGVLGSTRVWVALVVAALLVAATPAVAAPNEDNQPTSAPADYDAAAWRGWMTSAAADRVHDIAQIGGTVYVAGAFTGIRPTRTGTVTTQGYLAAFDATTGAPVPGFAPVLDGTVHALEPSADGTRLYIAGAFTTLNGATRGRLAAIDPTTGATVANAMPNVGGTVRSIVLRGTTLYLGGNFTTVAGVNRNRLAAVDTTTGALSTTWRPTAEGNAVLTLEMAPDGSRLYAGGRFSSINGQTARAWIAALDPTSGAIQTAFAAQPGREVFDLLADGRGLVWAALGGSLGRADVYRAVDGSLLTRHETEGDVEVVEEVGGLVYFGGHDIGPSGNEHLGIVDPAAPAILDASRFNEPSTGGDGLWAIHSTGRDLWLGGNVGNPWFGFTRHPAAAPRAPRTELLPVLSTWRYLDQAAPPADWRQPGFADGTWASGGAELGFGDTGETTTLQSGRTGYYFRATFDVTDLSTLDDLRLDLLADDGAAVYLNGTEVVRQNLPTGTITDTTRAPVGLSGNAEDTFLPFPVPPSALVEGTNTIAVEVHQNAAASSDLSFDARLSAVRTAPPAPDTTPPSTPTGLAETVRTDTTVGVGWTAATDDVGVDRYDVFVDGTLAGPTTATSLTITGLAPSSTHLVTVEAVDAAGNRSPPSDPLSVTMTATPAGPVTVIARGAVWRYRNAGTAPAATWNQPGFDDSTWLQGPAILGREEGGEGTVLTAGTGVRWFRRTFAAGSSASVVALDLALVADDAAAVYLNGVEVLRDNLPTGTLTDATLATAYRTGTEERRVRTFSLPTAPLVDGVNVLAVALYQASGSADASFDAALVTTGGTPDTSAPSVPAGLSSPAQGAATVDLTWSPATDDIGIDRYEVTANGAVAGSTAGNAFRVDGLAAGTTYSFQIEAIDAAGNRSGRSAPLSVSTTAAPAGPVELIAFGATWRYRNAGTAPPVSWPAVTFDDSTWLQGPAILGREEGGEGTVLTAGTGVRWFRRGFALADADLVAGLVLQLVADDGAVVFLNGTEVLRDNVPAGALTAATLATDYRTGTAERARRTFTLPANLLVDGANVLAVQLHQASGSTDASFDVRLATT